MHDHLLGPHAFGFSPSILSSLKSLLAIWMPLIWHELLPSASSILGPDSHMMLPYRSQPCLSILRPLVVQRKEAVPRQIRNSHRTWTSLQLHDQAVMPHRRVPSRSVASSLGMTVFPCAYRPSSVARAERRQ